MFPWCLVAFQKIFRKIFSGVWKKSWKKRRKTQMKGQTQATTQEKTVRRPRRQSRSTARSRSRLLREIAIDGEIAISPSLRDCDRRGDRDLRKFAPSIAISIRCDLAKARSRSSRDCAIDRDLDPLREIAINGVARSRTRDRDQRRRGIDGLEITDWRSRSPDRDRARARALSLSLSFSGNTLKGK